MLRSLIAALLAAGVVSAGLLPDSLGTVQRGPVQSPELTDKPVWTEYGLDAWETARYEGKGGAPFQASAWRLLDPTGAQAAFRWQRPAGWTRGNQDALQYTQFAVASPSGLFMTFGNYLLSFEGRAPNLEELKLFLFQLPKVDQSALPPVLDFFPKQNLDPGSERYIIGPASLEKFYPQISPSAVGFHFGTEALVGRYDSKSGKIEMALFYYPAPQMARERLPDFQKVPSAIVKRSGPLLAMIVDPPNADEAERLLSLINYRANVTINEQGNSEARHAGEMLVAIFMLIGLILALTIVAGIMAFGMRLLRRRMAGDNEDPMTMLHISDR